MPYVSTCVKAYTHNYNCTHNIVCTIILSISLKYLHLIFNLQNTYNTSKLNGETLQQPCKGNHMCLALHYLRLGSNQIEQENSHCL